MKKKEVQYKIDMTPIWEKKGEMALLFLTPFIFLWFCVVVTTALAWLVGGCQWLSESLRFLFTSLL